MKNNELYYALHNVIIPQLDNLSATITTQNQSNLRTTLLKMYFWSSLHIFGAPI